MYQSLAQGISTALIVAIVPAVLKYLQRSAQKETSASAGSRTICYPKAMRWFVMLGWAFTITIGIIAAFYAKDANGWTALPVLGLFVALILPLHLETFGASITWDDQNIYTRSPWRRRRTIPISAVKFYDYSNSMQWYRIHTAGYGIVRLHNLMRGVPELLMVLARPSDPMPPDSHDPSYGT